MSFSAGFADKLIYSDSLTHPVATYPIFAILKNPGAMLLTDI
jgi:hypothetical protein